MVIPEQGPDDLPWHEDVKKRANVGGNAEDEFPQQFRCYCGGMFGHYAPHPGAPDFWCLSCKQMVDTKNAPEARRYGTLTISQVPFDNYTDKTVIAWREKKNLWWGIYKKDAVVHSGPHEPTHSSAPTRFYRIHINNFVPLDDIFTKGGEDETE